MLSINPIKWRARLWLIRAKHLFVVFLLLSLNSPSATAWRQLAPGLEYEELPGKLSPWSRIHIFSIDLNKYHLSLSLASELSLKAAHIETFALYHQALITINGGFFDTNNQPLGLRISEKKQKSQLKNVSWWGVFYVKSNQAKISNLASYPNDSSIDLAIQSGPRLLVNGKIPKLKPGRAERSAVCIRKDGKIILLATEKSPLSTFELAKILKSSPLNCVSALNLDGGSSTQISAKIGTFSLAVHGFSPVADVLMIKNKF